MNKGHSECPFVYLKQPTILAEADARQHCVAIEKVMTNLATLVDEHRHQLVVARDQSRIRIDVDHLEGKEMRSLQLRQCLRHVIAQMTIGAGVKDQMRRQRALR
jgi:hypothetical protein